MTALTWLGGMLLFWGVVFWILHGVFNSAMNAKAKRDNQRRSDNQRRK